MLFQLAVMSIGLPLGSPAAETAPVPYPHPLITEILAAVPSGPRGDANGDGVRDAVGDEFIELVNPHDKPIQLKGYTLMDSDAYAPGAPKPAEAAKPGRGPAGDTQAAPPPKQKAANERAELKFVFPELELRPGQVVVVFNGYHQKISGNVGDATKAAGPNERFHDAFVFSMNNESPYAALGNDADFVLLRAPDGKVVHVVRWGKTDKNPPKDALLVEEAPASIGSVQRDGVRGKLVPHKELKGDLAGTLFSPGIFSLSPGVDSPLSAQPTQPRNRPGKPAQHSRP